MVTAVLTKYRREWLFDQQLAAVKDQELDVSEVLVCDNTEDNKGVWERFRLAQEASNDFVWILDDDIIPGPKYLSNVWNEFEKQEGLYGTRGLLFNSPDRYQFNYREAGWTKPVPVVTEVDYVTHSWFFRKEWLDIYWRATNIPFDNGEDMNFSFQLQKEGIRTFVPPHPRGKKEVWGNTVGIINDMQGLWDSNPKRDGEHFRDRMFVYFDYLIEQGWDLINKNNLI